MTSADAASVSVVNTRASPVDTADADGTDDIILMSVNTTLQPASAEDMEFLSYKPEQENRRWEFDLSMQLVSFVT